MDEHTATRAQGILVTWREAPRSVKALLLGVFVNKLAGFIQIFLVLFLTHRGFSVGQAGLALGVYAGGAVLGTFLGGFLTDRLSPRSATLISMLGSAVLILSILYLHIYALLLVAVFLVSTVGQLYRPAAQTLVTELTPGNRLVMVTAMYRLGMNLGTTVTPLIGAALVSISYSLLFWGEAVAALVYAVIAMVALPHSVRQPGPDADAKQPKQESRAGDGYLAMLADARYIVFLAAVLLVSVVYCQYTATLPLAIKHAGLSVWWYGAVVSLNGFIVVTCELLMTKLVQKWPVRIAASGGACLVAIGYGIYAFGMLPGVLIAGTLVWTLSEMIGAPTTFAYPGMAAPDRLRGRYIGAMQSLFALGTAVGPVVGILLWKNVGQAVWLWAAVVALVATVLFMVGVHSPAAPPPTVPEPEPAQETIPEMG